MYETTNVIKVRELQESLKGVVEEIRNAVNSRNFQLLEKSVADAKKYNMQMDIVTQAVELLEKLSEIENEASKGIQNADEFALSAVLNARFQKTIY